MESEIDSRPSDALALALRCAAPIYVAEEVMEAAGVVLKDEPDQAPAGAAHDKQPLTPAEVLKQQIAKAVAEERFEDAARLRDEMKKLPHSN